MTLWASLESVLVAASHLVSRSPRHWSRSLGGTRGHRVRFLSLLRQRLLPEGPVGIFCDGVLKDNVDPGSAQSSLMLTIPVGIVWGERRRPGAANHLNGCQPVGEATVALHFCRATE